MHNVGADGVTFVKENRKDVWEGMDWTYRIFSNLIRTLFTVSEG